MWVETDLNKATDDLREAVQAGDAAAIVAQLAVLAGKPLTYELLAATGVGKLVGSLRRHAAADVVAPAERLVQAWKDMIVATCPD